MDDRQFRQLVRRLLEAPDLETEIELTEQVRQELRRGPDQSEPMTEQEFKDRLTALEGSELEEQIGLYE